VTFHYAEPRGGSEFRIDLSPPEHSVECTLDPASGATCRPNTSVIRLSFVPAGLESIAWVKPPTGELQVRVVIDGGVATSQAFDYRPATPRDACTGECSEDPNFELH
jgi:hypothetical protein